MPDIEAFREYLRGILGSDFPEFIDRDAYRRELPTMWFVNPARAFLHLTDDDQAKVLQEIRGPR